MSKPRFDPTQPFSVSDSKPPFNPEIPFQAAPSITTPKSPTLAEKAVSAMAPDVRPSEEITLQNIVKATIKSVKDFVSPNKDTLKRALNPNVGQAGLLRPLEQAGQDVGKAVRVSAQNIAEKAATSKFGQKNPLKTAAAGAAFGTISDVMSTGLTPTAFQQQLGGEGVTSIAPGIVGDAIAKSSLTTSAAQRSLGLQKSHLVSTKSPYETLRKMAQAEKAAKTMLEREVITKTGNTTESIMRATKLVTEGSRKITGVVEKIDGSGQMLPADDFILRLKQAINPKYADRRAVFEQIVQDVKDVNPNFEQTNSLTLGQLDELKARWGGFGYQDKTVGTTASQAFRAANSIADKAIKLHIADISPNLLPDYILGKSLQESAITALRGLTNKSAAEIGNNLFSLPNKVIAAGGLAATGNPLAAASALGITEAVSRRGYAPVARGLYGLRKLKNANIGYGQALAQESAQDYRDKIRGR